MPKKPRPDPREDVLLRLRAICRPLPGAVEAPSYGNPAFKARGKPFAILDHYRGADCVWVRCDRTRRADILAAPGFFVSPYDPKQTSVCADPDAADWTLLGELIRESYESVAA